jgi:hypothetical protein
MAIRIDEKTLIGCFIRGWEIIDSKRNENDRIVILGRCPQCKNDKWLCYSVFKSGKSKICKNCDIERLKLKINQGEKYGFWEVLSSETVVTDYAKCMVLCRCTKCNEFEGYIQWQHMKHGRSTKCRPCEEKDWQEMVVTHGMSKTRIYRIWHGLWRRCTNPTATDYERYGAQGIEVSEEDFGKFEDFYKWSMDNGYRDDLDIDRIIAELGYRKNNCRWITPQQNIWNTRPRKNKSCEYKGVLKSSKTKSDRWEAHIRNNGKTEYLGRFKDPESAAMAYDKRALEIRGEYAWLNFPENKKVYLEEINKKIVESDY